MKIKFLLSISLICILISGCSSTGSYTSRETNADISLIGEIAKQNMVYEGIKRNPIIVVHGFQGANLKNSKTDKNIWGEFKGSDSFYMNDEKLRNLSHPMEKGKKLTELHDDIIPDGILDNVQVSVMGITVESVAYQPLIDELVFGGYQPENRPLAHDKHFNSLFVFAYDWRKDLPYNARELDKFIKEKKKYIQKKYKEFYDIEDFDVQFDVIAHSMGGLLSRYYLRYGAQDLPEDGSIPEITWAGSKHLDRIIIVGTPNAGYLDTFLEMLEGAKWINLPPAVLGTFPTYYQMLPAPSTKSILYSDSNEMVDVFDPKVWEKHKWGIMGADADETLQKLLPEVKTKEGRKLIAFDHLSKCLSNRN